MAVTKKEEQYRLPESQYPQSGYTGLAGVSDSTAQKTQQAQQQYQPSQAAQQAQQQLQQVQAQKPQTYNSKYGAQLDNILQQITNPKEFKYSFDGDELFKYYADLYTQKGKQASLDAMGQAAALTGGYGNSYGQMVGNQAFDQYLLSLYDKGMDLRDKAYQQYRDRMGDQQTAYNLLAAQDATDYGRYRDTVTDWQNDQTYWTNRADTEQDRAYNEYINNLNYWTQQAGAENSAYQTEREQQRKYDMALAEDARQADATLAEKIREFDANLEYDRMTNDQKYAAQYVSSILANGQMPSLELLKAAGLSEEDARKMMAQLTSGGSGGYKGKTYYTDEDYNIYVQNADGTYSPADESALKYGDMFDFSNSSKLSYAQQAATLQQQIDERNNAASSWFDKIAATVPNAVQGTQKWLANAGAMGVKIKPAEEKKKKNSTKD